VKTYSKILVVVCISVYLSGCASLISRPPKVILLPEERIFTIPGGQEVKVYLDHKEMAMTFPEDMKLVSPTILVRQEEKLNNALLNKVKADTNKNQVLGIIGTVLGIFGSIFGVIFFKKVKWPTFKLNAEVK